MNVRIISRGTQWAVVRIPVEALEAMGWDQVAQAHGERDLPEMPIAQGRCDVCQQVRELVIDPPTAGDDGGVICPECRAAVRPPFAGGPNLPPEAV